MNKLFISKSKVTKENNEYILSSVIKRNEEEFELFFKYYNVEESWIDDNFADPFFISILPYALENNYDIECELPLSSNIYDNIVNHYIPTITRLLSFFNKINIKAEVKPKKYNAKGVGTGVSCGVDSLNAIYRHHYKFSDCPVDSSVTHLFLANSGGCGWQGGEKSKLWFDQEFMKASKFANEVGLSIIGVHTNLMEFYGCDHEHSNFFRISGLVLGLGKLFKSYIYATGYKIDQTKFIEDDGSYLTFICSVLSDNNLIFKVDDYNSGREDKVKFISQFDITPKYLTVCWDGHKNCGYCNKCLRTIGCLYALDLLDKFKDTFDLDYFNNHRIKSIARMIYYSKTLKGDYSFLPKLKNKNKFQFFKAKLAYIFYVHPYYICRNITKKLVKKDSKMYKFLKNKDNL